MSKSTAKNALFFGSMSWLDVEDAPRTLPAEFAEARRLCRTGEDRDLRLAIELLQPFAHGVFIPESLPNWNDQFSSISSEYPARRLRLTGLDYRGVRDGLLPRACMEAEFEVPVVSSFRASKFDAWVKTNDIALYDAISFMWRIPVTGSRELELLTWTNNAGCHCERID